MSLIEASSVSVKYRGGGLGVEDVSIAIGEGEVVALLGPNGAGKTTTARALSGFLRREGARVVKGRIVVAGEDVTRAEPHVFARHGVTSVPERRKVFPNLTVRENLSALGTYSTRKDREARLTTALELFPILDLRLRDPAGSLSGGQQQMLAIARAFLSGPRLLILDELTLGLHASLHPSLFAAVRRIAETGAAVLLADEATEFALDIADRCHLLRAGHVINEGPAEMFRDGQLIEKAYSGR